MMSEITEVQFDIALFEGSLHTLDMARLFASHLLTCSQQRAQLLSPFVRHKACPDQTTGDQIGNPHSIVHVSLAARDILYVRGIGYDQLEGSITQDVPYRLPINPGRFHGDMGTTGSR